MEPITLAAVTTAVVTLALDAGKDIAKDEIKNTWTKVKGWLGWSKTPPTEDLATEVAKALNTNADVAQKILAELKSSNAGMASKLASKATTTVTNTTGNMQAGRDVNLAQGNRMNVGRMGG